ncbi:alpha/beta fold hydrolase [Kaistia dalseonensis]|uniref:Dipeptidyl aminopeptidase/acylaminoacyl peptidase n=1 Tax=Kaistia dalseonensis TaxID=410840 RepID=A0ABU0HB33_9HYPH|nr:alpha/beta fold hydrolase [Kaistia dalseonensis]MCX5496896.1 alpha/beta fold hydrolase [Kaistia dalseonensis]MDQ0439522.1 dipeptidyl aminopeptidase/acylaminoacyl peptidase [Kaistia dalseonensis]
MLRKLLLSSFMLIAIVGSAIAEDATARLTEAAKATLARAPGEVVETTVKIARGKETIVGTLALPKGVAKPPVVLLLHGFTGKRDELAIEGTKEGVYSRTARILAERGLASLRIDFVGSGESSGKWEDTTTFSQIADAIAAFDWLKTETDIDPAKIHVIGWSLGGLVASHLAAERPVASATLWAAVANPVFTFGVVLGKEALDKAMAAKDPNELIEGTLPWGAKTTLKAAFFQSLVVTDPVAAIARYDGPLFVIVGTKDTVVTPQPQAGEIFLTYHEGEESLMILPTDHGFDAFTGPATVDLMAAASLDFIAAH